MDINRRKFIGSSIGFGALLPPTPPGMNVLRSPKDAEHVESLKKVSVQSFSPAFLPKAIPVGLRITGISVDGNNVTLTWADGVGPFMIEQGDLTGAWGPIGNLTMARTQTVVAMAPDAFFRIHDKVPMVLTGEDKPDGIHLAWIPPTF
jgi:hypothetical protein